MKCLSIRESVLYVCYETTSRRYTHFVHSSHPSTHFVHSSHSSTHLIHRSHSSTHFVHSHTRAQNGLARGELKETLEDDATCHWTGNTWRFDFHKLNAAVLLVDMTNNEGVHLHQCRWSCMQALVAWDAYCHPAFIRAAFFDCALRKPWQGGDQARGLLANVS